MNRQLLYALGRPFSPFYSVLMRIRESCYRKGLLPVTRLDVPVISVGNLTLGGTGKTPVVQYLAKMLAARGMKPAVVSRGYRGRADARFNVVSDGSSLMLGPEDAGDEPRLLAETLPGIPVLTGRKRKYPAAKALELGADILILDDGFQHLGLGRTIDLVLFHADSLAGNSRVFPGGDLREPVKALNRCDAFVITNTCDRNQDRAGRFKELLLARFPDHPVFLGSYTPQSVLLQEGDAQPRQQEIRCLNTVPLFAFAGIARPEGFFQTLVDLGLTIAGSASFSDHSTYSVEALADLMRKAEKAGAAACITTEKDMVKLKRFQPALPLYVLQMAAGFGTDFKEFIAHRI